MKFLTTTLLERFCFCENYFLAKLIVGNKASEGITWRLLTSLSMLQVVIFFYVLSTCDFIEMGLNVSRYKIERESHQACR